MRTLATLALLLALDAAQSGTMAQSSAPSDIGIAASVVNEVDGTIGQQTHRKSVGDKVFTNEIISTGSDSKGQLLFRDETSLTVGPNSQVALDRFVYNPQGNSSVTLNATRGVFRFISGSLPSRSYEIKTPAATIGVRGTIVDIVLLPNGTAIFHNGEGSFVAATLLGNFTVGSPGQVLILRPGSDPEMKEKLPGWVQALLASILDPDKKGNDLPGLPDDGQDRRDQLRDTLRGSTIKQNQQYPCDSEVCNNY